MMRSSATVLIVEDEFLVALQIEDILIQAGHTVIGIAPDMASVAMLEDAPEIALVDINLRDGPSGPAIARMLAENFGTAIIYVTANPGQIGEPARTALGVVAKPFSQEAILAAVSMAAASMEADRTMCQMPPEFIAIDRPSPGL